ncbi:MAG: hypothetical protein KF893_24230 [Caldilineaceae bacterium]|nr:hypothetical protein [Caldilineaceae bacterium]
MRPYQRIRDGADEEIRHWYKLGLSLRQLEREAPRTLQSHPAPSFSLCC